jgi:hypothetical protein
VGEESQVRFVVAMVLRGADELNSMCKSRKLGWHGYVDNHEALFQAMQQLAELKMVPPMAGQLGHELSYHGYQVAAANAKL